MKKGIIYSEFYSTGLTVPVSYFMVVKLLGTNKFVNGNDLVLWSDKYGSAGVCNTLAVVTYRNRCTVNRDPVNEKAGLRNSTHHSSRKNDRCVMMFFIHYLKYYVEYYFYLLNIISIC